MQYNITIDKINTLLIVTMPLLSFGISRLNHWFEKYKHNKWQPSIGDEVSVRSTSANLFITNIQENAKNSFECGTQMPIIENGSEEYFTKGEFSKNELKLLNKVR